MATVLIAVATVATTLSLIRLVVSCERSVVGATRLMKAN